MVSAVLVDGGHDGLVGAYEKVAGARIMETIPIVEQKYDFVNGITQLQFDSCVVTHWDRDHYFGFLYLILEDFRARGRMNLLPPPTRPLSRFYKCKGQNECLTTLFCPVFVKEDWKTKPGYKGAHYTLRPSGDNVDSWLYKSIDSLNAPKKGKLLVAKLLRICKRLDGFVSLKRRDFFSLR